MITNSAGMLLVIILWLSFGNVRITAQENLSVAKDTTGAITDSEPILNQKMRYLDLNLREEKTLIKLGVSTVVIKYVKDQPNGAYIMSNQILEKKIIPSLSVLIYNNIGYSVSSNSMYSNSWWSFSQGMEIRCYYSINKRIREFTGANNFNSNYFSIRPPLLHLYYYSTDINNRSSSDKSWHSEWYTEVTTVSWGIQRRLGKWAYFDVGPELSINNYGKINLMGKFQIGLAYGR